MATLATQQITPAGIVPSYVTAGASGDKVRPGDTVFLHVKNATGGSVTVSVDDPTSVSPSGATAFNPDLGVAIANGAEKMIGPITSRYANPSDGLAAVTYSATGTTVAALAI